MGVEKRARGHADWGGPSSRAHRPSFDRPESGPPFLFGALNVPDGAVLRRGLFSNVKQIVQDFDSVSIASS
jgi:hypothetical protein